MKSTARMGTGKEQRMKITHISWELIPTDTCNVAEFRGYLCCVSGAVCSRICIITVRSRTPIRVTQSRPQFVEHVVGKKLRWLLLTSAPCTAPVDVTSSA